MAAATRGVASRVVKMPTTDTLPKCQATKGSVKSVAATPAATPFRRDLGARRSHPTPRALRSGGAAVTSPSAPANESWKPGRPRAKGS